MKSSNEVRLRLEVLEDRMALSGAFGGAIEAGAPSLTPFPFNGLTVQTTTNTQTQPGLRDSFANVSYLSFSPAPSLQSQLQSLQSAQTAAIDQLLSDWQSMVQSLNLSTVLVI
ncbi:MAG TPA: hypothetical protein VMF69_02710 [Gemmataceae bacterium]|nr:hypothetical protein [Gemmataceae bacterium]